MKNIQLFSKASLLALLMLLLASTTYADQWTNSGFYLSAGMARTQIDTKLRVEEENRTIAKFSAGCPSLGSRPHITILTKLKIQTL